MRELIEKRTARSKTWDLENGKFATQIGGGIAHHQKNGAWVDTDSNWTNLTDRFGVGEFPFAIDFRRNTRTLTIDYGGGDVLTLTPLNMRTPTSVVKSENTVTLVRLWTGITLKLILSPEGVHFNYIKTATTFVNPSFSVTGDWATHYGPNVYAVNEVPVTMPQTLVGGVLAYDFAEVPVGIEVT
jgi:hypothetical protein